MFKLNLYCDENAEYFVHQTSIIQILDKIKERWDLNYEIIKSSELDGNKAEKIKSEIRMIPPQIRGKIVSSRNYILPLSGSKNLNLKNTPILLLCRNDLPLNVFPHLLGMTYHSIESFLDRIFKYGPADYLSTKGILENPLQKMLSEFPSMVEEGMRFLDLNVELENGEIDLLFKDREGKYVIVELETFARDISMTQVCRLASEFLKKQPRLKGIRKMIVCFGFSKNILGACKDAGVELYKVKIDKMLNSS